MNGCPCNKVTTHEMVCLATPPRETPTAVQDQLQLKTQLFAYLASLGITDLDTVEHPPAHTLDQLMPLVGKRAEELGAAVAKNLFLRDKKRRLYLLSVRHDRKLDLNAMGAHSKAIPYFII